MIALSSSSRTVSGWPGAAHQWVVGPERILTDVESAPQQLLCCADMPARALQRCQVDERQRHLSRLLDASTGLARRNHAAQDMSGD